MATKKTVAKKHRAPVDQLPHSSFGKDIGPEFMRKLEAMTPQERKSRGLVLPEREPKGAQIVAIAGKYLNMPPRDIVEIAERGARVGRTEADWEGLVRLIEDLQKLAGSVLNETT